MDFFHCMGVVSTHCKDTFIMHPMTPFKVSCDPNIKRGHRMQNSLLYGVCTAVQRLCFSGTLKHLVFIRGLSMIFLLE